MNRLSIERRVKILNLLVEGMSMRSITRTENVGLNTIGRLIDDAGAACAEAHNKYVMGIQGDRRIECDEVWSFVYSKQKNMAEAKAAPDQSGDAWVFTAIDANSKLVISYLTGDRGVSSAIDFMRDLRMRLDGKAQITTDGYRPYPEAVENAFGQDVDFTQIVKSFESDPDKRELEDYDPLKGTTVKKVVVMGDPDLESAGTTFVERNNLTLRMGNRRFTRMTNAFSKKIERHIAMVNLFFLHYNFCRIHKTLGITPAMEAGISDTLRDMGWIVNLIDARYEKPKRPKKYKKRRN